MKIYVASSWRNQFQPEVVRQLRNAEFEVYDFRHPTYDPDHTLIDNTGFHWSEIDPDWKQWTPQEFRKALDHPVAKEGFDFDFNAMRWADACVLVMPCGRSAHLEAGWFVGAGKPCFILLEDGEPELMYAMTKPCIDIDEVIAELTKAPQ